MRDVRMRGFAERADVEDVERFLAERVHALGDELVPVLSCAGRVLAANIEAPRPVPNFDRSAMDGYAVRGADTFGASDYAPLRLEVIGESMPGRPFAGEVGPRQAVRIMTGAPVPRGADAVLMAEVCSENAGSLEVRDAVAPHKNVGTRGEDIREGDTVLHRGRVLRAQDAAILASLGCAEVPCVRRPRVRFVITGDELVAAGETPEGSRIVDSNSVMLRVLLERDGGELLPYEILPDREERIRQALGGEDADVVLVSGGSSVGREDFAPGLVAQLGSLDFHGIAMRPSSPTGVGRIGERIVFLLPGNPVSCLCAYEFFAGPTLRRLGGRSPRWPHPVRNLPLARKISSAIGRVDYVRVAIEHGLVIPLATSGASILSSTVRSAGFVIVPRELEGMAEGEKVEVRLYDAFLPDETS